jgi:hypothetical protein
MPRDQATAGGVPPAPRSRVWKLTVTKPGEQFRAADLAKAVYKGLGEQAGVEIRVEVPPEGSRDW